MKCSDVERLLAAKADGALDAERERALDTHLSGCAACRRLLDDQVLVRSMLAAAPVPDPPRNFLARVNAAIDAEDAGWFGLVDFRAWTFRLVPAAAAIALVAVLWPSTPAATNQTPQTATAREFRPSQVSDWERDVSANALLDAALRAPGRDSHAR
jgi:anti-sigma factor RsiW